MKKLLLPCPRFLLAILITFFSIPTIAQIQSNNNVPQLGKNSIQEIIAAMTLEEKAKLVVGMGFKMPGAPVIAPDPEADKVPEKVNGAAGRTHPIARLGIPSITVSDGPAGVRIDPIRNGDSSKTYYATAFPVGVLLASSWDTALIRKTGAAFGHEALEYGVDILLGPGMNIHRNPLGGRNFEYYSEDPLVTGYIAAAIVNGIQSNGVGTTIKHFVANNQETNSQTVNTIVSERALREIYLRGFEIAVKNSQPWAVMSSYNKLNGAYTSERPDLLTTVLKNEWGFTGLVMTDWGGGKDPVAQMKAGNDLIMPGSPNKSKAIMDAVNNGTLDVKQLNANVANILHIILLSPEFKKYKYSNKPNLANDAMVSRTAASEGMVLLKDEAGILPLNNVKKIALFGNASYALLAGGTGSGNVNKAYSVSLMQGLINAGYIVDETLKNDYTAYIADAKMKQRKPKNFLEHVPPITEMAIPADLPLQAANSADIAVITIGRSSGEGADRKLDNDFYLSAGEKESIKNITDAFHAKNKKTVVVLNIGGVIETVSWRDEADAILLAWQPGQEGGNAITDILSGKINPSGKLATTFPVDYADVPSAKNFPGKELPDADTSSIFRKSKPSEVTYEEGIYVGYRYYTTFHIQPAYEFGYGLSYTHFAYSNLIVSDVIFNGQITASVTVTNNGTVAGKEVVQLYLSAPAKKSDKPAEELKAFAKTNLLEPGKSQTIIFTLNLGDLASFDTPSSSWIAEAGDYTINIGASSSNIVQTKTFHLVKDWVVEKLDKVLSPQVRINELTK